jgi:hypothetical protein
MISKHPDFLLVSTAFPMFGANIQRLWGNKEFVTYMKDLVSAAQNGAKTGFPVAVLEALQRLEALHDQEFSTMQPHMDNNEDFKTVSQNFPVIAQKLNAFWGRKEFGPFMTDLLHDSRGDNRKGFPFDTLMALHALAEQHNKEYGHLFPAVDMWNQMGT